MCQKTSWGRSLIIKIQELKTKSCSDMGGFQMCMYSAFFCFKSSALKLYLRDAVRPIFFFNSSDFWVPIPMQIQHALNLKHERHIMHIYLQRGDMKRSQGVLQQLLTNSWGTPRALAA